MPPKCGCLLLDQVSLSGTKGAGDFGIIDVLINNFIDGRKACYPAHSAPLNTLFLIHDAQTLAAVRSAGQMPLNGQREHRKRPMVGSGAFVTGEAVRHQPSGVVAGDESRQ